MTLAEFYDLARQADPRWRGIIAGAGYRFGDLVGRGMDESEAVAAVLSHVKTSETLKLADIDLSTVHN